MYFGNLHKKYLSLAVMGELVTGQHREFEIDSGASRNLACFLAGGRVLKWQNSDIGA